MAAWILKNKNPTIEEYLDRIRYVRCPNCIHEEFFTYNMLAQMAPTPLSEKGVIKCVLCKAQNHVPFVRSSR